MFFMLNSIVKLLMLGSECFLLECADFYTKQYLTATL